MLGEVLERWLLLENWHLFEVHSELHCLGQDLIVTRKKVLLRINIRDSMPEEWSNKNDSTLKKLDWLQMHRSDIQLQLSILLDQIDTLGQDVPHTEFRLEGAWCYNRKCQQVKHYNSLVLWEEVQGFDRSLGAKAAPSIPDTMRLRNISNPFSLSWSQTAEQLL